MFRILMHSYFPLILFHGTVQLNHGDILFLNTWVHDKTFPNKNIVPTSAVEKPSIMEKNASTQM